MKTMVTEILLLAAAGIFSKLRAIKARVLVCCQAVNTWLNAV
jgi:hypothetical protein